ncbi:hypothetical protein OF83DRAFT_1127462 [Amylostereum chailletii]|nr:hypothetical protein OF83DRAFT_1127462 [Amylostereum chailletii]
MIGRSISEYVFIRLCILGLQSIAPLSIAYLAVMPLWLSHPLLTIPGVYALAEASFYLFVYMPRRYRMQRPTPNPPSMTHEERKALFMQCTKVNSMTSVVGWFVGNKGRIQRENAVDWLLCTFFPPCQGEALDEWHDEIESYLAVLVEFIGYPLEPGRNPNVKALMLTLDPVVMRHRPLGWYAIVAIVDTITSASLLVSGFRHYNTRKWFSSFPPRPLLSLLSRTAPETAVPYWYRPHRSPDKLPILFLHGIGIGLWPYVHFFKEIVAQDPDVGVLAIEILPISMHMAAPPLPRDALCDAIERILDAHALPRVVVAAHSYGTIIAAHLYRSPRLSPRVASTLFIDPIPFLLHHPAVAYNFVYRAPRGAHEWQLWYFASRDADVARTLSRYFFWHENVLFKEDLAGKRVAVSLAERDQIVDAQEVRRYLTGEIEPSTRWVDGGGLEVLFFEGLDHATVFEAKDTRRPLMDVLHRFVREA